VESPAITSVIYIKVDRIEEEGTNETFGRRNGNAWPF